MGVSSAGDDAALRRLLQASFIGTDADNYFIGTSGDDYFFPRFGTDVCKGRAGFDTLETDWNRYNFNNYGWYGDFKFKNGAFSGFAGDFNSSGLKTNLDLSSIEILIYQASEHDDTVTATFPEGLPTWLAIQADGGDGVNTLTLTLADEGAALISTAGVLTADWGTFRNFQTITILFGNGADTITGGVEANIVSGGGGDDQLRGGDGDDRLDGGAGADTLAGGGGDDTLVIGHDADVVTGGSGRDTLEFDCSASTAGMLIDLRPLSNNGTAAVGDARVTGVDRLSERTPLIATDFGDSVYLGNLTSLHRLVELQLRAGDDAATGSRFSETIRGGAGKDTIDTGGGADLLDGGTGDDVLTGGAGADVFAFLRLGEFGTGALDLITDFSASENDKINLSFDADLDVDGIQIFTFVGGSAFTGTGYEVRAVAAGAGEWRVEGDTDRDGVADFAFLVHASVALTAEDFEFTKFTGTAGNDKFTGTAGDDIFTPFFGNDKVNGADGMDKLILDYRPLAPRTSLIRLNVTVDADGTLAGSSDDAVGFSDFACDFSEVEQLDYAGSDTVDEVYITFQGMAPQIVADGGDGVDVLRFYYYSGGSATMTGDELGNITSTLGEYNGFEKYYFMFGAGNDQVTLMTGALVADGASGNDILQGGDGEDELSGGRGQDILSGGGGDDMIIAGSSTYQSAFESRGGDTMTGGTGADTFVFSNVNQFKGPTFTVVTDFSHAEQDLISVRSIDPGEGIHGDQAFVFIGEAAFDGRDAVRAGNNGDGSWTVQGDMNGDRVADFSLIVFSSDPLITADFVL